MFNKPPKGTPYNYAHPLARGLIGYWLFNEGAGTVAYDIREKKYPATLTNLALSGNTSNWVGSQMGGGISLDGSNDYIDIGNSISNPPETTFVAWVYFNRISNAYTAVTSRNQGGSTYYQLFVKSNGKLAVYVRPSGGACFYDGTGSFTLSTNTWYQLSFTYSTSDGLKGYVNGKLDGTSSALGALSAISATWAIGTDLVNAGRYLNGIIDEVRIYNRALNQSEVQQLYTNPHVDFLFDKHYINPTLYGLGAWGGRLTNAGGSGTLTATSANKTIESYMVLGFKKQ